MPARPHHAEGAALRTDLAGADPHRAGRRDEAAAACARILPLINYENRQRGLRATKTVMMEGVIKSDAVRHPLELLDHRLAGGIARAGAGGGAAGVDVGR
jgi:dihydrodipicolinate synthase/N-acetylneuraminate lyase